jgi:hypothetical protein
MFPPKQKFYFSDTTNNIDDDQLKDILHAAYSCIDKNILDEVIQDRRIKTNIENIQ